MPFLAAHRLLPSKTLDPDMARAVAENRWSLYERSGCESAMQALVDQSAGLGLYDEG